MQDLPSQTVISAIVEDEEHNQIIISLLITAKWVNWGKCFASSHPALRGKVFWTSEFLINWSWTWQYCAIISCHNPKNIWELRFSWRANCVCSCLAGRIVWLHCHWMLDSSIPSNYLVIWRKYKNNPSAEYDNLRGHKSEIPWQFIFSLLNFILPTLYLLRYSRQCGTMGHSQPKLSRTHTKSTCTLCRM